MLRLDARQSAVRDERKPSDRITTNPAQFIARAAKRHQQR